jgi:N-acetylneuraminate synthase
MIDFNKLEKPYLIGEIGINHNGDLQIAKRLIDAAFATSWSCVKFQKRNPDKAVPEHQKDVEKETPWGKMTYLEYKYRVEFKKNEYDLIDMYCKEKPIDWTASVWDLDSLEFLTKYSLPFLKVPSAMLTNDLLLTETCKSGYPVILSTGMSTLEEVDHAFNILSKYAGSYALLHTNSAYPAKSEDLNLNVIPFLIDRYKCTVGYSGHEYGLTPTVIATAIGAMIIERHITVDRYMWGTDQLASVEIEGMDSLSKRVREVKTILGNGEKKITETELAIKIKLRG